MLQVYKTAELSNVLGIDRHLIGKLRKYGILQGVKIGKSYIYSEDEIKEFLKEYRGGDLSNDIQMQIEIAKHKKRR